MVVKLRDPSGQPVTHITNMRLEQNVKWLPPSQTEFDNAYGKNMWMSLQDYAVFIMGFCSEFESSIYPNKKYNVMRMRNKSSEVSDG